MTLLEVTNLSKRYRSGGALRRAEPVVAVDGVDFQLDRGRTLAIVGESGAGKSTTAQLLLRLIEPDTGSAVFDGTDIFTLGRTELRKARRRIQMVFQDPYSSFDPRVPLGASVAEPLVAHFGTNRPDRERAASDALGQVGLGRHLMPRLPHELSGGQLQRAAIARALTLRPDLIVCDEAVSALDVSVRAQVLNLLMDIQEELGVAYLFISHDLSVVEAIADDVIVMANGRIVERGSVEEVFDHPQQSYTQELLAALPIPDPTRRRTPDAAS